jgi:hypothetical protein
MEREGEGERHGMPRGSQYSAGTKSDRTNDNTPARGSIKYTVTSADRSATGGILATEYDSTISQAVRTPRYDVRTTSEKQLL